MGGASDQIFVFKALTSSIGLLASGLLLQGLSSESGSLFGIIFSFKTCSSPPGLFASDLFLLGFHLESGSLYLDYLLIQDL